MLLLVVNSVPALINCELLIASSSTILKTHSHSHFLPLCACGRSPHHRPVVESRLCLGFRFGKSRLRYWVAEYATV